MNKQLRLRDGKIKTAYWSLVGVVAALLVSTQAVFAADMWDRFSMIMKDIYGELVAISTIVAVTVAAIALLVRMISRNQRAVDEATSWLKRIVITWIVLNSLGFIVAYLQPLISGGNYNPYCQPAPVWYGQSSQNCRRRFGGGTDFPPDRHLRIRRARGYDRCNQCGRHSCV